MKHERGMHLTFRWYADTDSIPLRHIRQIPGMRGIVSALYDLAPGAVWPTARLLAQRKQVEDAGLEFRVVESIPVAESIKLGNPDRDRDIDAWIQSLRSVAAALNPASATTGSEEPVVVTYNFMPVFDWTRSDLARPLPDGSTVLAYDAATVARMDPLDGELSLPGWLARYSKEEMYKLLSAYREMPAESVYQNLLYFLRAAAPEAESLGVRLALHPDDPPWPIFGIPRVMTCPESLRRLFADVSSKANGLCLCSGSFGALPENDVPAMAGEFGDRVAFAHLRNIKITGERSFEECAHLSDAGSLDMGAIVDALVRVGYNGPVRPDHGRMIWNEKGKPGYGLYDRALGAAYINGLVEQSKKHAGRPVG